MDRYAGTGAYALYRNDPSADSRKAEAERIQKRNEFARKVMAGEVKAAFWSRIGKQVQVLRYRPNKGMVEVFYEGCRVDCDPYSLSEIEIK